MREVPFIAVEGPIGIGKTSLATRLSSHFHFHLLKEIVDEHPFLNNFYEDMDEWSFQTEMFFLCHRYKQLEDIQKIFLQKDQPVVADYHIAKSLIFARQTLHNGQLEKYEQIFDILTKDLPLPNILIYLTGSMETIMHRVRKRGRDVEKNIEIDYLKRLADDYDTFIHRFEKDHPGIPVLRMDANRLDFVDRDDDFEKIIKEVGKKLTEKGRYTWLSENIKW